jgi:Uma2 family endonuclease
MSTVAVPGSTAPPFGGLASLRRFSVAEYHKMIQTGILTTEDRVELLDGYVVLKMPQNPPHGGCIDLVTGALLPLLPPGWFLRAQLPVTLSESEPEPDFAVVRGTRRSYLTRHPGPADVGLVIEVSDSTLDRDRGEKQRIYAAAGIVCYWIVNLVQGQVEVYTGPAGAAYPRRDDYRPGDSMPLTLDGVVVASVPVVDLLP